MKTYVLYHGGGCADGFCSAWVARSVLGADAEYIPVQYGQEPPTIEPGSRVYILDFSYPREVLTTMAQACQWVNVLDHHATAEKDLKGLEVPGLTITFDMTKSGARLTWQHFHSGELSPWLVNYTEDRDLWKWEMSDSREVNAALRSFPLDFAVWDDLLGVWEGGKSWLGFIEQGAAILRSERQLVERHVRHAREIELCGYPVLAVNATVLQSEIAGELAKGRAFGACWFERQDGAKVWSLRSDANGIDVSEVAKKCGGGGHPRAAGFQE